jgi:hypothetical protein
MARFGVFLICKCIIYSIYKFVTKNEYSNIKEIGRGKTLVTDYTQQSSVHTRMMYTTLLQYEKEAQSFEK